MDFSWNEEQEQVYLHTMQFVKNRLADDYDPNESYWKRTQWLLCGEAGLLGLSVPVSYGGGGYKAQTTARALEAFGTACKDMGLVFSTSAHLFACCMPIAQFGCEEIREQYLPSLCSGAYIGANAITEKGAGSDIYALNCRAIRDNDGSYILNGTKSYVSNGPMADTFVVYARTNPAHGYLGISAFVLEREMPGLVVGEPFHKMGLVSTPACQIALHDCRLPEQYRLGQEGQGAQIFQYSMQWERCCLFASYVGAMERQLQQVLHYAQQRRQFGSSLGKKQVIAHRIADMKLRLETARLLLYRACWLFDQGKDASLAISLSKLAISEAAVQSGLDAIHIHGSSGITRELGIERMLRDAIPSTIFSGTSEMQRDLIAREIGL